MQTLLLYIFKLSIALSVVFLFYQLVLRRLTFYNCNRWYLTGYTLLSFLIPLINITPVLEDQQWQQVRILEWVPVVTGDTVPGTISTEVSSYEIYWSIAGVVFCVVSTTLLIKLWLQLYSFMRVMSPKPFGTHFVSSPQAAS